MATPQIDKVHDLDDSVLEYFEFRLKGHIYRFRHMNTDEAEELQKLENDEEKSKQFIFGFITKVDPNSPDFSDLAKQMIIPHWRRFRKMIEVEMNALDGNS